MSLRTLRLAIEEAAVLAALSPERKAPVMAAGSTYRVGAGSDFGTWVVPAEWAACADMLPRVGKYVVSGDEIWICEDAGFEHAGRARIVSADGCWWLEHPDMMTRMPLDQLVLIKVLQGTVRDREDP